MSDRIVRLVVEARVDAERPELCSWLCPFLTHPHSARESAFCDVFDVALEGDTTRVHRRELRCEACLAAESQPDEKP